MSQTLDNLYQTLRQQLLPLTASEAQASTEAALILDHVLHIPQETLYSNGKIPIEDQQANLVQHFLEQRIQKRIPIQYLLHQAVFYGLEFYVNPHVLIPRPETELLVEQALAHLEDGMSLADIGTGPGTIAIAV
jgi:release factor glutamine methyltransferase